MSTAATQTVTLDISGTKPVPFGRLVNVEMRKMSDTRAGLWLLIAIGAATAAIVAIFSFASSDKTFIKLAGATTTPIGVLLPVLGILLITSEWGQRTTLTTFALTPGRSRVLGAKVIAACLVGLAAVAVAMGLAAIATAVAGADHAWAHVSAGYFAQFALVQVLTVLGGLAFGVALLNSPAAIVLYLMLPQVFSILFQLVSSIKDAGPWLVLSSAVGPLASGDGVTGEQWAQVAVASLIWIGLPFALGLWRVLRVEIK